MSRYEPTKALVNAKIGEKIMLARRDAKLDQSDLVGKIGESVNTISRWENGKTSPDVYALTKIATATGKPFAFFVDFLVSEHPECPDLTNDVEMKDFLERFLKMDPEKQRIILTLCR